MFFNVILIFSMIFIANKTRELEKNNNNLKIQITKLNENIKINKIELNVHKKISHLNKLYPLYFSDVVKSSEPNVISINRYLNLDKNIELVKSNN